MNTWWRSGLKTLSWTLSDGVRRRFKSLLDFSRPLFVVKHLIFKVQPEKQRTKAPGELREVEHMVVKWFKTVTHALVLADRMEVRVLLTPVQITRGA